MLPDFPKVKEVLVAHATAYVEQLIRQEPILRSIRRVHHFEGSEMRTQPSTGPVHSSEYERYTSANIDVPTDAIIAQGPAAFLKQIRVLAEDLKAHQVRTLLSRVSEAADSVGNVVHAGGQPYGPDLFLEMLEKISISFDEDGNPQMPMAVVSPETGAYIRAHAAAWEADPAFRERHARILQRKREEWDDRERHRELVD
jgi:hypothetical protein